MGKTIDAIQRRFSVSNAADRPVRLAGIRGMLAYLFGDLGFKTGAEIGVERGKFSQVLLHSNPGLLMLHAVDAWALYEGYRERYTMPLVENMEEEARLRLAAFEGRYNVIKAFSMDAVELFRDGELDFVYIDANHSFDYAVQDIIEWSRKVRPGGIVAGHDYVVAHNTREIIDVIEAVNAYTRAHQIAPWFVIDGAGKENASYFWVKP